jgi:membrane associated rhomboid family serine protease
MRQAAVGFQCPDCVREGARTTRTGRLPYGGQRSRDPRQTTIGLIAANVAVWLAVLATGGAGSRVVDALALLPQGRCGAAQAGAFFPNVDEATCHTALAAGRGAHWVPGVSDGAVWQLLTSAFTHVEVWHIGFNMLALFFLGPLLESVLGRARFLAVYLVSALAGSAAVMLLASPGSQTLGASGAIFGLMGALIVVGLKVRANLQQLWFWLGLNLLFTFTAGGISWQGHLGGLLGGVLTAGVLVLSPRPRRETVQAVGTTVLGLVFVAIALVRATTLG